MQLMTTNVRPRTSLPWRWILPGAIGLGIGAVLGAQYAFLKGGPETGLVPASFAPAFLGVVVLGGAGLLGLLLLLPSRTRAAGHLFLAMALAGAIGWPVGMMLGPHYEAAQHLEGSLEVTFSAPVAARLASRATCTTAANSDDVVFVDAPVLGWVGIDRIGARVSPRTSAARVELLVNEGSGYAGSVTATNVGASFASGAGSFEGIPGGRYRLGGDAGAAAVSGTVAWTCSRTPSPSPDLTPEGEMMEGDLQGWFTLGGVVDMPHPCASDGPCLPYGRAMATCRRDVDLRTSSIETVVPWLGASRARLILETGRQTATLTVHVDDGSPPERVTGSATVIELHDGSIVNRVGDRRLRADFGLAAGQLHLEVEWSCGDNVEPVVEGAIPAPVGPAGTAVPVQGGRLLVQGTGGYAGHPLAFAFDGNRSTFWNSGGPPQQWIQVDLLRPASLTLIRLNPEQTPAGHTIHQVLVGESEDELRVVHVFDGITASDRPLVQTFDPPLVGIRYVRVLTLESPSWTAWREVEIVTD